MARTKAVAELTVEQQIAQIQKEAADKIKQLQTTLPWHKRFNNTFSKYLINNVNDITKNLNGYEPNSDVEIEINNFLSEVNLSIKYDSATFDNDLYNNAPSATINDIDLSEYPVYTIFAVLEDKKIIGYIKINCQYSSYNGNEYSGFSFVQPKEITCKVFISYKP